MTSSSSSSPDDVENRKFPRDWLRQLLRRHATDHPDMPDDLRDVALVVAPMVDASDLPYRLLARRYNANLCYTPMIHAKMFVEKPGYRRKFWKVGVGTPPEDRPLIAQFCGHDKDVLLAAMKLIENDVDGVDINCGCPQGIAKRGRYGAYLMEEDGGDRIVDIVSHLSSNMNVPVSVKLRILPSGIDDSLLLYERLVNAGASLLTIHGRNRHQKQNATGNADWDAIRKVVNLLGRRVPIIANGGISNLDDVRMCLEVTGADGVMSSEAILEYPPLFTETNVSSTNYKRTGPGRLDMAMDYLELCRVYPPNDGGQGSGLKCVRAHMHRFLHADMQRHTSLRDAVVGSFTMEGANDVIDMARNIHASSEHDVTEEKLSWYVRHRVGRGDNSGKDRGGKEEEDDDDDEGGEDEEKKDASSMEEEEECPCDVFGEVCADDGDY
jgi:tRNA-dihydrouridine synthase 1